MRWVFRLFSFLVLLVLVAGGLLLLLPSDRIAQVAVDQIKAQTGRDLQFEGDVSVTYWPVLGVTTGPVSLSNADWGADAPMFTAKSASIGVDAVKLISGDIRITKIEADSPTIRLEKRKDGRANWVFGEAGSGAGAAPAITLERLSVQNARLIYSDEGSAPTEFSGVDLNLRWPDSAGAATIEVGMAPAGSPVQIDAVIDGFAEWIAGGTKSVTATLKAGGGVVEFEGRASTIGEGAGAVRLSAPDTASFLTALGQSRVELPKGMGRAVDLSADVTLTRDQRLSLRKLVAKLDQNTVTGAADIVLSAVPQVNAQFETSALDLAALTGGETEPAAQAQGWSKAPIDLSGLAAFNGEISLKAAAVDLGMVKLGASRLLMTLDRSRAVFDLREVNAYGGIMSGQFVTNNRNGLSVGGNISAKNIETSAFLGDLMGVTRLSGPALLDLKFLGVGNSLDAIMRSLSGGGALRIAPGTISGFDLDRLMGSADVNGGVTRFDSLGGAFTIKDGNLRNDDLLMLLTNFQANGAGRIGIGAQDIDYLFTPKALRINSGKGFAIPVRVTGPWANPKIRPDVGAAIDLNLAEEKEEIKTRVKDSVQRKLGEKLNVAPEEGQSVEDALKDKVEDKLKKGLLKLFD